MKFLSRLGLGVLGAGLLGMVATSSAQAQAQGQIAYAIANGGTSLIRFSVADPTNTATLVGAFNGGATFLDTIDFRPLNGQLYGYLDATDTLYTVNTTTATLTAVATGAGTAGATNTFQLGMDFNPMIDRVRVVTDSTQNLVYNPNSSAAPTVATALAYGVGDANNGANPLIIDNAYTNNFLGSTPASTVQYGIDYGLDSLVTIANNAGTLTTVGLLGVNTDVYTGFDIYTNALGVNTAYAIFDQTGTLGARPTLYTINLTTGAATQVGSIGGGFGQVYGLAVTPTAVAAPEPGSIAFALLGGGALAGRVVVRRRKAA